MRPTISQQHTSYQPQKSNDKLSKCSDTSNHLKHDIFLLLFFLNKISIQKTVENLVQTLPCLLQFTDQSVRASLAAVFLSVVNGKWRDGKYVYKITRMLLPGGRGKLACVCALSIKTLINVIVYQHNTDIIKICYYLIPRHISKIFGHFWEFKIGD